MELSSKNNGRGGLLCPVRLCGDRKVERFKQSYMEGGMNSILWRELELVGDGIDLFQNCEGAD